MPTLMLVPTGIGCAIGGYAGDALPSARLMFQCVLCVSVVLTPAQDLLC